MGQMAWTWYPRSVGILLPKISTRVVASCSILWCCLSLLEQLVFFPFEFGVVYKMMVYVFLLLIRSQN